MTVLVGAEGGTAVHSTISKGAMPRWRSSLLPEAAQFEQNNVIPRRTFRGREGRVD